MGRVASMTNLISEFITRARIGYYELALSQLHPGHPDVPLIVCQLRYLNDHLEYLKGKA